MLTLKEGEFLVKAARQAIEAQLRKRKAEAKTDNPKLKEKMGAFVSLHTVKGDLRGCIGYLQPVFPIIDAVCDAAVSAAVRDTRFDPVKEAELKDIIIEISVLTPPEQLKGEPADYKKQIEVGKHGLIIESLYTSGTLLPQVAVEEKWDAEEFLSQTCWKAGLEPSAYFDPGVRVYRYQAQIFSEEKPGGKVIEKKT
jgi:hypothetical protein